MLLMAIQSAIIRHVGTSHFQWQCCCEHSHLLIRTHVRCSSRRAGLLPLVCSEYSGRHRYYLPSLFWYCKHVCIVLAPKGTVTIIIIKENYFTSKAVYMSNTLLAKHCSVFASFNFGCEGSRQHDARTFQILFVAYTNIVHQLTHRCD